MAEILGTKDLLLSLENGAENELCTVFENYAKKSHFFNIASEASNIYSNLAPKTT